LEKLIVAQPLSTLSSFYVNRAVIGKKLRGGSACQSPTSHLGAQSSTPVSPRGICGRQYNTTLTRQSCLFCACKKFESFQKR